MRRQDIEEEMRNRASRAIPQTHLVADYYRIRRKVAYPLPIREIHLPEMSIRGIESYPWATWMTWDLEERIGSLGWSATWFGNEESRDLACRDLQGLAEWPGYRQHPNPDLSSGHAIRTLWLAYTRWNWLPEDLKSAIETAFKRHIEDTLPLSENMHGSFGTPDEILSLEEPHSVLHNIPFIGTVGLALAASAISHSATASLFDRIEILLMAMLELRKKGHTEGVGYDGYIWDFAATWMSILPEKNRLAIQDHARFWDLLDESVWLSAPGDLANVAEFSDVEPREMPFHISAHAKFYEMAPDARMAWYLSRCRLDWLRTDALAALHNANDMTEQDAPDPGYKDAHYALVLRTGWCQQDLAAAISVSNSRMGHVQCDNGSIVIGTRSHWFIADPGYQQYMKTQEREFTLGAGAHNAPVINGRHQCRKLENRTYTTDHSDSGSTRVQMEFASCYPNDLGLDRVSRTVHIGQNQVVAIQDKVVGPSVSSLKYHWHGNTGAAWWVDENWARIYLNGTTLWVTSPQVDIKEERVSRLPGSRGHQTLGVEISGTHDVVWWVFVLGNETPALVQEKSGIRVNDHSFSGK